MTTLKLVNLMMRSSDTHPYSGKLSKKDNVLAAIELAKLAKDVDDVNCLWALSKQLEWVAQ